jgi:hypothetical protein
MKGKESSLKKKVPTAPAALSVSLIWLLEIDQEND